MQVVGMREKVEMLLNVGMEQNNSGNAQLLDLFSDKAKCLIYKSQKKNFWCQASLK